MSTYNLQDPDVLNLVRSTHRPVELPPSGIVPAPGPVAPVALVLVCNVDHEPWPCAVVAAVRALGLGTPSPPPRQPPPPPPPPPPRGGGSG